MAAVLKARDKFSFDDITQSLFHDLVEQASDDTHSCDAIMFRGRHQKHNALIDQLVDSGFIIHDKDRNSYRLYSPFLRVLDSVYITEVFRELNSLLKELRSINKSTKANVCDIFRLSAQSNIRPERIASLSLIMHWLGLVTASVDLDRDERHLTTTDAIMVFDKVQDCMDHRLQQFDVSKDIPHAPRDDQYVLSCNYTTPLLELLHETIDSHFSGRPAVQHPDKDTLLAALRGRSVNGRGVSKKMAECIYDMLRSPS